MEVTITTNMTDLQLLISRLAYVEKYIIPEQIKHSVKNIERDAKRSIRTGRRSGIHYSNLPNRSSAAGEPPKTQSGALVNSIVSKFAARSSGYMIGSVGSTLNYGLFLEKGAVRRKSILEPRPWLKPALERELPLLTQRLKNNIKRHV